MMTFDWPWLLLLMPFVVAAALVALLRRDRHRLRVGSLRLWERAQAATPAAGGCVRRRFNAPWILLLAGATIAVLALARPAYHGTASVRRVAVVAGPSAEFTVADDLARPVGAFLDRLNPSDHVWLVWPDVLGGTVGPMSPGAARREVYRTAILSARFDDLSFPAPPAEATQAVAFIPAGARSERLAADGVATVSVSLPAVTIDRFGAVSGDGKAEVLVALRNNTEVMQPVHCEISTHDPKQRRLLDQTRLVLAPLESEDVLRAVPASRSLVATVYTDEGASVVSEAYLVGEPTVARTVALLGRDHPMLRRFVAADPLLELTADAADADLIIANGVEAPPGAPALVVSPSFGDDDRTDVGLGGADVAADDPVMRGVDFAGVAVRALSAPVVSAARRPHPLVAVDGQTIIWRSADGPLGSQAERRVVVDFDLAADNTNWTLAESFVIFMANAVRWLLPPGPQGGYDALTPVEAGDLAGWEMLVGRPRADGSKRLAWPGLYEGPDGQVVAVSVTGLSGHNSGESVVEQISTIPLSEPSYEDVGRQLWPVGALLGLACWLAAWALQARMD